MDALGTWRKVPGALLVAAVLVGLKLTLDAKYMSGRDVDREAGEPPDSHTAAVLRGCGEVCRIDVAGTPGKFFQAIRKKVDCSALLTNAAIDASMEAPKPPERMPPRLAAHYTYGGRIPVASHLPDGRLALFDERTLRQDPKAPQAWPAEMLDAWAARCADGTLAGSYGVASLKGVRRALDMLGSRLQGADVLVIGSERPWLEACAIAYGAAKVTTLEYREVASNHTKLTVFTPAQLREHAQSYMGRFDVVLTFSSLEHSGLGRYSDALNPWGDRQAAARAWCMTKKGGQMLVGLPVDRDGKTDTIYWNAHRNYGLVQLPHLLANWQQQWQSPIDHQSQRMWICGKA